MENSFKQIYQFNKQAGLLDLGYSDKREIAYPIEEMLEGCDLSDIADRFDEPENAKDISRAIASHIEPSSPIPDVDRLDKHLDAIIFCLGSIYKLGLTPQEATKALSIVANANMKKLSVGKDSEGKQLKPANFIPPEPELQKIIDVVHARHKLVH